MRAPLQAVSSFFPAPSSVGPGLTSFRRIMPLCSHGLLAGARSFAKSGNGGDDGTDVMEFLDALKNYEKLGVPRGAGTESSDGFDLSRMRRLLFALGDPLSKYPVVHIAGTKGKGSTAAFISNILRAEGYCVGSYTSPHIMSIHERLVAGKSGDPITPGALQGLFQDNRDIIKAAISKEEGSLTHFEVLTALAFQYFAAVNVDIAVVEAGLGGARDATNVISPLGLAVAVITNIGKEHLAALGGSLESIALAKSGIIKQGRPVVLGGPLDSRSEEIICKVAASKSSVVMRAFGEGMGYRVGHVKLKSNGVFQCCDISINSTSERIPPTWKLDKESLQLQMMGIHQLDNVLTAICTILCLRDQGWQIQNNSIWSGLERTSVPGRFQIVLEARKLGCGNLTLVLDGAHTASSAKALASTLKLVFPSQSLAFVIAMASDKDHYNFCSQLLTGALPSVVVATESLVAGGKIRSTPASLLTQTWDQAAKDQYHQDAAAWLHLKEVNEAPSCSATILTESESVISSIKKASQLLQAAGSGGVICVTGSLHAVSEVLSFLQLET